MTTYRGLLADAEAQDGDGALLPAVERFQVYPLETRGVEEPDAVTEQHGHDIHQDLVHETPPQALTSHVSTEDFEVLPAGCRQGGGDRFPDITAEVGDIRFPRVGRLMSEDEDGSGEGVALVPRFGPPLVLGLHPATYLNGPPPDEHGAGGSRDLGQPVRARPDEVEDPVHGVSGTGDKAVKRHRPVHDDLAAHLTTARRPNSIAISVSPSSVMGCPAVRRGDVTADWISSPWPCSTANGAGAGSGCTTSPSPGPARRTRGRSRSRSAGCRCGVSIRRWPLRS